MERQRECGLENPDPRQMSLFAAAWTLGSIVQLTTTGLVHSMTYYETTGWRGLMETPGGSANTDRFVSSAGDIFPLFYVFALVAGYTRFATLQLKGALTGLVLFNAHGARRVLLANLSAETQHINLLLGLASVEFGVLDELSAGRLRKNPGELPQITSLLACPRGHLTVSLTSYSLAWVNLSAS